MNSNTVETRGRLIYIEPNEFAAQKGAKFGDGVKPDNIVWDPEDLNMAVDLQVVVPRRDDCGDNEEFDVNIHTAGSTFMHNFVSFLGGTKIGKDGTKSTDRMLTDSYTDISYNEIRSGGRSDRECIGISSIDIKFDSHFYPVVNMKFSDIRGYSLFMPAEQQYLGELDKKYNYKNFFQAVFHFPYPRFLLTIKGFYGNKVTFILAVNEFKSSLNSQTGNIDVDISFIGYMYGLYTEIPMTMVLCAPYIDMEDGVSVTMDNVDSVYGKYWADQRETTFRTMDDSVPLPTMLEYLVKYMNVTDDMDYSDLESVSEMVDNQQEKLMLEDIQRNAKNLNDYLNGSLSNFKKVGMDNASRFTLLQYDTELLKASYEGTGEYVLNTDTRLKELLNILFESIRTYNESDYSGGELGELFYPFNYDKEKITFKNFYYVNENGEAVRNDKVNAGDKRDVDKKELKNLSVEQVEEWFPNSSTDIFKQIIDSQRTDAEGEKRDVKFCNAFIVTSHVELYNKVSDYITKLNGKESELSDSANDEIEETFTNALGFKLSLENVYRMIFAHIDCFMHEFNKQTLSEIKAKKNNGERTFTQLGLKHDSRQTDVKAKSDNCFVPPFFALYNNDRQIEYPGTANIGKIDEMQNLDEVRFVDKLDKAAKMCGKIYATVDELMERRKEEESTNEGADVTADINWTYSCFTDFMFGTKNPYSVLDFSDSNMKFFNILYIYYLRWLNHINTTYAYSLDGTHERFHNSELENLKKALPEQMSNNMYNELIEFKNKVGDKDNFISLFNQKAKDFKERFCKSDLNKICGKKENGIIGLNEIPIYFSNNPLYAGNGEYDTLYNKGYYIAMTNFKNYETQLTKSFSEIEEQKDEVYRGIKCGGDPFFPIAEKPNEKTIDEYNAECSEDTFLDLSINYQDNKNNKHNYWYVYRKTGDEGHVYGNNFNSWLYYNHIKELFGSDNIVNKVLKLKPEGDDVWNNLNGINITNYQLTLACHVLASMFPLGKFNVDYDEFQNLLYGDNGPKGSYFWHMPKCMALMVGSLIFRWRKLREFGKDVIYFRNTTEPLTCINDVKGYMHCSSDFIDDTIKRGEADIKPNYLLQCVEQCVGSNVESYFTNENWYEDNNKYATFESLFCTWVTDEFLPIYESFLETPKMAGKGKADSNCGFRKTTFEEGGVLGLFTSDKEHITINSESKLNDFLCNLMTERISVFKVHKTGSEGSPAEEHAVDDMILFVKNLNTTYGANREDAMVEAMREADETNKEIKKALYYSLKNLYDKWICSYGSLEKFTLQTPEMDRSNQKKRFKDGKYDSNACREFNNFLYVDSLYNYIGDDFMVNPMELYELIMRYSEGDKNNSVYEFMAEVAEKNKLLMVALPVYTNFYNRDEVMDIFTPHDIYNANSRQTDGFNNTYVIMYTHEASKHLDDISNDEIGYEGDGYDLADSLGKIGQTATQLYNEKTGDPYNLNVNAFGVTYGMQNQSYFTDISVNMDNPIVTDYSIANQLQLSQTAAHGDVYYPFGIGQNIYSIYSNRSYTCTVTMLGCANIMPMMYFQLNNVPMFKGAYMIISVSHSISAGRMYTTFTGIRQSKYLVPFNKNIFNITSVVQRLADNEKNGAKRSGTRKRNNSKLQTDENGDVILTPSASLKKLLLDTNKTYGGNCFPKDGNGDYIIPTSKTEMNKYITDVKVKVRTSKDKVEEKIVQVNKGIAKVVEKAFNEVLTAKTDDVDYCQITNLLGWQWRNVNGTNSPSIHAYGLAIDINACIKSCSTSYGNPWYGTGKQPGGPYPVTDRKDTPGKFRTWNHPLVQTLQKNGIWWGYWGDSNFDSMHFGVVLNGGSEGRKTCK